MLYRQLRSKVRSLFFKTLSKALKTDDGRKAVYDSIKGNLLTQGLTGNMDLSFPYYSYPEINGSFPLNKNNDNSTIIISARFRSGSTLLWNIFRHIKSCTAYYEPLNERNLFDLEARGNKTDNSHINVTDYWREYDGLQELKELYQLSWIKKDLYMGSEYCDPNLRKYLDTLISHTEKRAVLQFNRADFRLPWLRRQYPKAKIVHLYRHPRDQWVSTLPKDINMPKEISIDDFKIHDGFYLNLWTNDLKYFFPILGDSSITHPYQLSYLIWRLSYAFGKKYSDYSLCYEDLLNNKEDTLASVFSKLEITDYDINNLSSLITSPLEASQWKKFANDEWFRAHEDHCDKLFSIYT